MSYYGRLHDVQPSPFFFNLPPFEISESTRVPAVTSSTHSTHSAPVAILPKQGSSTLYFPQPARPRPLDELSIDKCLKNILKIDLTAPENVCNGIIETLSLNAILEFFKAIHPLTSANILTDNVENQQIFDMFSRIFGELELLLLTNSVTDEELGFINIAFSFIYSSNTNSPKRSPRDQKAKIHEYPHYLLINYFKNSPSIKKHFNFDLSFKRERLLKLKENLLSLVRKELPVPLHGSLMTSSVVKRFYQFLQNRQIPLQVFSNPKSEIEAFWNKPEKSLEMMKFFADHQIDALFNHYYNVQIINNALPFVMLTSPTTILITGQKAQEVVSVLQALPCIQGLYCMDEDRLHPTPDTVWNAILTELPANVRSVYLMELESVSIQTLECLAAKKLDTISLGAHVNITSNQTPTTTDLSLLFDPESTQIRWFITQKNPLMQLDAIRTYLNTGIIIEDNPAAVTTLSSGNSYISQISLEVDADLDYDKLLKNLSFLETITLNYNHPNRGLEENITKNILSIHHKLQSTPSLKICASKKTIQDCYRYIAKDQTSQLAYFNILNTWMSTSRVFDTSFLGELKTSTVKNLLIYPYTALAFLQCRSHLNFSLFKAGLRQCEASLTLLSAPEIAGLPIDFRNCIFDQLFSNSDVTAIAPKIAKLVWLRRADDPTCENHKSLTESFNYIRQSLSIDESDTYYTCYFVTMNCLGIIERYDSLVRLVKIFSSDVIKDVTPNCTRRLCLDIFLSSHCILYPLAHERRSIPLIDKLCLDNSRRQELLELLQYCLGNQLLPDNLQPQVIRHFQENLVVFFNSHVSLISSYPNLVKQLIGAPYKKIVRGIIPLANMEAFKLTTNAKFALNQIQGQNKKILFEMLVMMLTDKLSSNKEIVLYWCEQHLLISYTYIQAQHAAFFELSIEVYLNKFSEQYETTTTDFAILANLTRIPLKAFTLLVASELADETIVRLEKNKFVTNLLNDPTKKNDEDHWISLFNKFHAATRNTTGHSSALDIDFPLTANLANHFIQTVVTENAPVRNMSSRAILTHILSTDSPTPEQLQWCVAHLPEQDSYSVEYDIDYQDPYIMALAHPLLLSEILKNFCQHFSTYKGNLRVIWNNVQVRHLTEDSTLSMLSLCSRNGAISLDDKKYHPNGPLVLHLANTLATTPTLFKKYPFAAQFLISFFPFSVSIDGYSKKEHELFFILLAQVRNEMTFMACMHFNANVDKMQKHSLKEPLDSPRFFSAILKLYAEELLKNHYETVCTIPKLALKCYHSYLEEAVEPLDSDMQEILSELAIHLIRTNAIAHERQIKISSLAQKIIQKLAQENVEELELNTSFIIITVLSALKKALSISEQQLCANILKQIPTRDEFNSYIETDFACNASNKTFVLEMKALQEAYS